MSPTINLDVEGPEYFCPDCGRWLARAHPDTGTFDLAYAARISLVAELPVELSEDQASGVEMIEAPTLMAEAVCLRRRCRLRRWLRGHG